MAAISVQVPYPVFYDRDGQPLDNGNIYIGDANLDPIANPLQVYYDEALTIPASQPLKTSNGYIYRNGTPAQLYVNAVNFSILVNDAKNTLVYSFPDGTGIGVGAASIEYDPPFVGAVTSGYTVEDKLAQYVSVKDFGAVGDGVADDTAAIQAALDYCETSGDTLGFPAGDYLISASLTYNHQAHSIVGGEAVISAPSLAGYALVCQGYTESLGTPVWQSANKSVNGLRLKGARVAGQHGILLGDPAAVLSGSHATFENVVVESFDQGVTFSNNSYLFRGRSINIFDCVTALYFPNGLTNAGENVAFLQSAFFNSTQLANVNASYFYFFECSFDYFTNYAISAGNGAIVRAHACHFETDKTGDYFVKVADAQTCFYASGMEAIIAGAGRSVEIFNGGSSDDGGVFVEGLKIGRTSLSVPYTPQFLAVGNAWELGPRLGLSVSGDAFVATAFNKQETRTVDPDMATNVTNMLRRDWFLQNSDQSGITFSGGKLQIQPPIGTQRRIYKTLACGPGSKATLSLKLRSVIGNATDTLTITGAYFDQSGGTNAPQSSFTRSLTYNQGNALSSETVVTLDLGPAPRGTAGVRYTFATNASAADGNTIHYIDDLAVDVNGWAFPSVAFDTAPDGVSNFTPVVIGSGTAGSGAYATQVGRYTLVGNRVFFDIELDWTGHTGVGSLQISGLPFPGTNAGRSALNLRMYGVPFTGPVLSAQTNAGSRVISILQTTAAGAISGVPINAAGSVIVSGSYIVSAA